jgi:dGTPase
MRWLKIILNTKTNIRKNKIKNINDIYNSQHSIVCFSKKMNLFDVNIKKFLKKRMYFHKSVILKTNLGKKIIKYLFFKIKKNPKKYINMKNVKKSGIERTICDFIAGMTDRYAINLYNKSK